MEILRNLRENYHKKQEAGQQAFLITEALKGYGHSYLLGGQECADYLHSLGLDDDKIFKMKKKYIENPTGMREYLEDSFLKGV